MAALAQAFPTPRLSAWVYFSYVTLVTAAGLGVAMLFRPPLAHSLASFLGLERQPRAAPDSFYAVRIAPLFQEHCAGCHGARRQRANLRLDSFAAAMRGGNHGPVILPADVKSSELLTRLMLPPNNEKAMPPSGRPPLSTDDVKVIRLWIAAGASGQLPVAAIPGTPPLRLKVEFPTIDADAVARARAPLVQAVTQLQARFPGVLSYESRGSADLLINASLLGHAFGDAALAAFAPVSERVVWADLSGTSITDSSAQVLSQCKRLRVLRLGNTQVAELTARALTSLPALTSLTAAGSGLSPSSLATLRGKGVTIYDGHDSGPDSNASS